MRCTLFGAAFAFTAAALAPASAATVAPAASETLAIDMGHSLALRLCSTCHDVSSGQQSPPAVVNAGPGFAAIANRRTTTRESVRLFLDSRHGGADVFPRTMPDLMLTDAQKAQAAAYIMSLRKPD